MSSGTATASDPASSSGGSFAGGIFGSSGLGGSNLPLPFIGFSLAAIALFIIVVAFVLLRIFIRNRRLRRMGIFVEDDFIPGRFMAAGPVRPLEDTLVPPKLWEAKIADVRKVSGTPGGGGGTGGSRLDEMKEKDSVHTWETLMPVAAALPPNLYPILFENENQPTPAPAPAPIENHESTAHRIARRVPRFSLRRRNQPEEADPEPAADTTAQHEKEKDLDDSVLATNSEPTAASVNITVLIAMPSSKTVFPSQKRSNAASTLRSPLRNIAAGASITQVDEVEEEGDGSIDKGKMKRTPSLRSVRTATSVKSVAEARRQAFFGQEAADRAEEQINQTGNDNTAADEEEELPELVFGTASVPVFRRVHGQGSFFGDLVHPTKGDLLTLLANARNARERKSQADAERRANPAKSGSTPEAQATEPAGAAQGTRSVDTDARPTSVASSSHPVLGDVVSRMMQNDSQPQTPGDIGRPSTQHPRSSFGASFDMTQETQAVEVDPLRGQASLTSLPSLSGVDQRLSERSSSERASAPTSQAQGQHATLLSS